jgi:phosphatidylserine/phosphatidylglycerophosphate/cardiolipin synthase-like enzyme
MATLGIPDHPTISSWLATSTSREVLASQQKDQPNYWAITPPSLITQCNLYSLKLGTSHSIYKTLVPSLEAAEHEIILVTCFWAKSSTLDQLNNTLLKLSAKGAANGRKIRVRICFSSCSLWQKLFHNFSLKGKTYQAASWTKSLGLPHPDELVGLDLEIKSIFVLPFSVMHPKFILVDRQIAFLPSCNVSWEDWFEGCLEMSGPVVNQYIRFWTSFWASEADKSLPWPPTLLKPNLAPTLPSANLLSSRPLQHTNILSLFLPSPHHQNPTFRLPWQASAPAPQTPLNTFLLTALARAEKTIYIQTPNLTSPPVLAALSAALARNVHVRIVTSEGLMLLEQLVTAGTTTSRCVKGLIKNYKGLCQRVGDVDLEAGSMTWPGAVHISYYVPRFGREKSGDEPMHSHLKLTIVHGEISVFGSGNMDRASWFTSQELGVAFFSREFAGEVEGSLQTALEGRTRVVFDSLTERQR